MKATSRLESIGHNLLPAIAYGDAAGLPVETRSYDYIVDNYGSIDRLMPVRKNPFYIGEFGVGTWSDDTQLSSAVARALVCAQGFDMEIIAEEHSAEYEKTPQVVKSSGQAVKRGWGGSTTRAIERYKSGVPIEACGEVGGAGNGVIMKMAPLAWWLIAHDTPKDEAYRALDRFTSFTHNSDVARVASRVHYDVLAYLAKGKSLSEFGRIASARGQFHEQDLSCPQHDVSKDLLYLADKKLESARDILDYTDGKGFYVPQTLAMAYGAFMLHKGEFTASVFEAVNLGGDTDSTASIVAAMSVFAQGDIQNVPRDIERVAQIEMLRDISRQLTS